ANPGAEAGVRARSQSLRSQARSVLVRTVARGNPLGCLTLPLRVGFSGGRGSVRARSGTRLGRSLALPRHRTTPVEGDALRPSHLTSISPSIRRSRGACPRLRGTVFPSP